ncbi:NAD(P)-dependent alcohol dehydrogenase [Mycetocola sp.]|uniref:NAD(P)-dependent alcohol dehydrogenase n=1 Tax=Mycetocola sp. TaxID=1871042 RepID=UPI003988BD31
MRSSFLRPSTRTGTDTGTMSAAVHRRFGPPEVVRIEEVTRPAPRPDEILVRVLASTLSIADHRARDRIVPGGLLLLAAFGLGFFRPRHRVLGMDAAGVVESVGANVTRFRPGDEVIAMLGGAFGGHSEYVCVNQNAAVTTKPANLSAEGAVALVFGGVTAHSFLNLASLQEGTTVLINGASGAVGSAAVQLAKHAGAHVTAVCSSANADLVSSLGADRVIDYTTTDFADDGSTWDVIVDCAGTASFERAGHLVNPGGSLLLVITDLTGLLGARRHSRRSGKRVITSAQYRSEDLAFLVKLAESGIFRPVLDRTYDLADIVDAHRYVDRGGKRGNVVVRVAAAGTASEEPRL